LDGAAAVFTVAAAGSARATGRMFLRVPGKRIAIVMLSPCVAGARLRAGDGAVDGQGSSAEFWPRSRGVTCRPRAGTEDTVSPVESRLTT